MTLRAFKWKLVGWCEDEIREQTANDIAVAIERPPCRQETHYPGDDCLDCARYEQSAVDAAIARRIGEGRLGGRWGAALAVLRIADLPDALAGEPNLAHDVNLSPALVVRFPDRGIEGGDRCVPALLVALAAAAKLAQRVSVHDPTIQCANRLDKRTVTMPRWLA